MPRKTTPKQEPLGPRIRAARTKKRLSRRRLAQSLDCDPQTIYRWEQEGREPSLAALRRLAAALGVGLGELLD